MQGIYMKGRLRLAISRSSFATTASLGLLLLSGCARAPSFNILGSFFPAWLLCIIAGILLASGVYWLLTRAQMEKEIRPGILVYPCLAMFFAFMLWLIFFS
jgi:hypothetical protein